MTWEYLSTHWYSFWPVQRAKRQSKWAQSEGNGCWNRNLHNQCRSKSSIETESYWSVGKNKVAFQQLYISWWWKIKAGMNQSRPYSWVELTERVITYALVCLMEMFFRSTYLNALTKKQMTECYFMSSVDISRVLLLCHLILTYLSIQLMTLKICGWYAVTVVPEYVSMTLFDSWKRFGWGTSLLSFTSRMR